MTASARVVMVTGCLGFLAGPLIDALLFEGHYVIGLDAETYAADCERAGWLEDQHPGRFRYIRSRVEDIGRLPDVDTIFHLAAETHVCNSVEDAGAFIRTNVLGTHHLLDRIRAKRPYERPLLIHVSTDEVYGSVEGVAGPDAPLRPGNPYSASKAAADHLVQAYGRTYDLRYRIIRPSNCYGVGQFPEKLIPRAIRCLTLGQPIPVHGDGSQTRSWLHVDDCARAMLHVWEAGTDGAVYNIGGEEASVMDVAYAIAMRVGGGAAISSGHERKGQDTRYAVDDSLLRGLGWKPSYGLWDALPGIVEAERHAFRW